MAHAARKYQKVGGAQDFKDPVKFSNAEVHMTSNLPTSAPGVNYQVYSLLPSEVTASGADGTFRPLVIEV